MEHYALDTVKRMQAIKTMLDGGESKSGDADADAAANAPPPPPPSTAVTLSLLDELEELVADLDAARDWTLIGGLPTLLKLVGGWRHSDDAAAVAKGAAAVLATAAASNPPVQDFYLERGAMPELLCVLDAKRPAAPPALAAKALLAVSALVRHSSRGGQAFLATGGAPVLATAARNGPSTLTRRALRLAAYVAGKEGPTGGAASLLAAGLADAAIDALSSSSSEDRVAGADAIAALAGTCRGAVAGDGRVRSALAAAAAARAAEGGGDPGEEEACAKLAAVLG